MVGQFALFAKTDLICLKPYHRQPCNLKFRDTSEKDDCKISRGLSNIALLIPQKKFAKSSFF